MVTESCSIKRTSFPESTSSSDEEDDDEVSFDGDEHSFSGKRIPMVEDDEDKDGVSGSSSTKKGIKPKTLDDKMSALIDVQNASGMFEIPDEIMWEESVFNMYTGSRKKVKLNCPKGVPLNLWITALAMKIMELKMSEKKELWELVFEKSKKYLAKQLMNNEEEYNKLQDAAEKYVMNA